VIEIGRALRAEISERIDHQGTVVLAPEDSEIEAAVRRLAACYLARMAGAHRPQGAARR
jgi:hypothetical protein